MYYKKDKIIDLGRIFMFKDYEENRIFSIYQIKIGE